MTIGERIKKIRTDTDLNARQFAQRLGISSASVSLFENDKNGVSNQTIRAICTEFSVNENWLRYEEGEPYAPASREEELGRLVRRLMSAAPGSFQAACVTTLLRFDPEGPEWAIVEKIYNALAEELQKSRGSEESRPGDSAGADAPGGPPSPVGD